MLGKGLSRDVCTWARPGNRWERVCNAWVQRPARAGGAAQERLGMKITGAGAGRRQCMDGHSQGPGEVPRAERGARTVVKRLSQALPQQCQGVLRRKARSHSFRTRGDISAVCVWDPGAGGAGAGEGPGQGSPLFAGAEEACHVGAHATALATWHAVRRCRLRVVRQAGRQGRCRGLWSLAKTRNVTQRGRKEDGVASAEAREALGDLRSRQLQAARGCPGHAIPSI